MGSPTTVIGAIADVLLWVSAFAAVMFLLGALVARIVDGDWLIAQAYLEDDGEGGTVARWFDERGDPDHARLSASDTAALAGKSSAEVFIRRGGRGRMRLNRRSPAVKGLLDVGIVLVAISVVAFVVPWVLMIVDG